MLNNRWIIILLLLISNLMLFGCGKELIITKYYVLSQELQSPDKTKDSLLSIKTLPFSAEVTDFEISKAYSQNRIVVRTQSNEIYYYFYHSWAENPESAVRYFIWDQARRANLFQQCEMEYLDTRPQYQINGIIDQIERTDMKKNYSAHLKMTLLLEDMDSGLVVVKHDIDRSIPLRQSSNMNTFAQKISQILLEECDNFIIKVYNTLKE